MKPSLAFTIIAASLLSTAAASFHLTLVDSRPREGAAVSESPSEIVLKFNLRPDTAKSGIGIRGPAGAVKLGPVTEADSNALIAKVLEPLSPGEYTVSWRAAPYDDHGIRGRYKFTVASRSDQENQ